MKKNKEGVYYNPENNQIVIVHTITYPELLPYFYAHYEREFENSSYLFLKNPFEELIYLGEL